MPDTANHSHIDKIDQLDVRFRCKYIIKLSLSGDHSIEQQLQTIDDCIDFEGKQGNRPGVLSLLEFRREVMVNCPETEEYTDEAARLVELIQSLARELDEEARADKKAAEAARLQNSPLARLGIGTLDEGKRASRPRGKQRRPW